MVFRSAWSLMMSAGLALAAVACGAYPDRVFPKGGDASVVATGSGGTAGASGTGGGSGAAGQSGTGGSSVAADSGSDAKSDSGPTGPVCKQPGAHPGAGDCRCADGTVEQEFSTKMVGCGDVRNVPDAGMPGTSWDGRDSLCGFNCKVCTANQWIAGHPSGTITPPKYNYWTDDNLVLTSGTTNNCAVAVSDAGGGACPNRPMRVCVGAPDAGGTVVDPAGTTCDTHECGLNTAKPNNYFGGCVGNRTAGALCCCP